MRSSDQTDALATALAEFQGGIDAIPRTKVNPFYKSKFAPLEAIVAAVREPLASHGLSVLQGIGWDGGVDTLTTRLQHASGQWVEETCRLETRRYNKAGEETPPTTQNVGASVTYMRRVAYAAILGLVTDEDDDGNSSHDDASGRRDTHGHDSGGPRPASDAQIGKLRAEVKNAGFDSDKTATLCTRILGREIKSVGELTSRDASVVIDWLVAEQEKEGDDAA
jgi:hypothetical protein